VVDAPSPLTTVLLQPTRSAAARTIVDEGGRIRAILTDRAAQVVDARVAVSRPPIRSAQMSGSGAVLKVGWRWEVSL
jgi:hypothetical protein